MLGLKPQVITSSHHLIITSHHITSHHITSHHIIITPPSRYIKSSSHHLIVP